MGIGCFRIIGVDEVHIALAEVECGDNSLDESGSVTGLKGQSVLDDVEGLGCRGVAAFIRDGMGDRAEALETAVDDDTGVALGFQRIEDFGPGERLWFLDAKGDHAGLIWPASSGIAPDGLGGVVEDGFAGVGVEESADVTEPDFEEVAEFSHSPDSGARGFDGVALADGDGGTDVLSGFDARGVEQIEKLACVGAKGLDVAALAFCVQRLECE